MSRKNKTLRAFLHQNPNPTTQEIWNAAWKAQGNKAYSLKIQQLEATIERIRAKANKQAEDWGLWFETKTTSEAYLQQELRSLHAAIEQQE